MEILNRLTFLDFFAGMGGFRLGMEQAGHKCLGYVEIMERPRIAYEGIHNTEGEWTDYDIRTIRVEDMPRANVWCGGWPCQDNSKNGKGEGLRGNRSGLFFSITNNLRQLKEEDKPELLFLENVENTLHINGGFDFLQILLELDEIGYDPEWQVINSREHGIAQNRARLYLVGHFRGATRGRVFPINGSNRTIDIQRPGEGWKVKNATKKGYDIATPLDSVNLSFPNSKTRRGRVGKGYLQTLDRSCSQAVYDNGRWRRITPLEAFRAQGFPDIAYMRARDALEKSGLKPKTLIKELYSLAGNSVTVPVIYQIAKRLRINN